MTKIFNDRPLFYCFLAFGLGIFLTRPIFSGSAEEIVFVLLAAFGVLFLCIKYKKWRRLFLIILCFALGVGTFFISIANFDGKDYGADEVNVLGRVCVSSIYDNSQQLILDNVTIDGKKISHNINVYIYSTTEISEGTVLSFNSTLAKNNLFTLKRFNSYLYKYNVLYTANVNDSDIVVEAMNKLNVAEKIRICVKDLLFANMDREEASVSYASLFGDKTYISDGLRDSFSVSGIAHLLAVSGLHIGFVALVLSFILKKLRVNKYARVGIFAVLLGLYCYLCSFSASVIRASLMFGILELAHSFGEKYDRLNAWSIAGIICVLCRPLCVFDPGFLLSFACVFCIFMFVKPTEELLLKWHLPKKLATTFGVMIPVQIGILPLLAMYFKKVSILSLLSNIICIPIFEMFFILLFLLVPIVVILPFLKFLLVIPEFIISVIIQFANFTSSISWAIVNLIATTSIFIITIYLIMFLCSHFVNLKIRVKSIASLCILFVSLLTAVLTTYPLRANRCSITTINVYGNPVYCLELNGVSFVVGEFNKSSISQVEEYVIVSRLYGYDYYISLNYSIPENCEIYKNIFCYSDLSEAELCEIQLEKDIKLEIVYLGDVLAGIILRNSSNEIYVAKTNKFNHGRYLEFAYNNPNVSVVLGAQQYIMPYMVYLDESCLAVSELGLSGISLNGNKVMHENFSFEINNGKIYNMRGVD